MKVLTFYCALIFSFFILTGCSGDESLSCSETITLQSYEQDGYKLILNYESSDVVVEASITSGSANPDDGIILPVTNNVIDFAQAGLTPGNYGLYLRTVCNNGSKGEWINPLPITIKPICNITLKLVAIQQLGTYLQISINGSTQGTNHIEARFRSNTEVQIVNTSNASGAFFLDQNNIEPGNYQLSVRANCENNSKTAWSEPLEITITDYHCMEPYNISTYIFNGATVYFMGNYDYDLWEYAYLPEGQPISSVTLQTSNVQAIHVANIEGYDFFVRGVCSTNTYTDWVQAF